MKNINQIEISQKDLRGITLHDFHSQLLKIGPVDGSSLIIMNTADRGSSLYAEGEPYCTYDIVRSNGFDRQNAIEKQWEELFHKHVVSFSHVLIGTP